MDRDRAGLPCQTLAEQGLDVRLNRGEEEREARRVAREKELRELRAGEGAGDGDDAPAEAPA